MRFLAFLLIFALPALSTAQCWGQGRVAVVTRAQHKWVAVPGDDDQVALYFGNRYLGNYSYSGKYYRPIVGNDWGAITESPVKPPCRRCGPGCKCGPGCSCDDDENKPESIEQNFGVDSDKLQGGPRYQISGRDVDKGDALRAVDKQAQLPDDAKKFRMTIIGTDAERKPVLDDWKAKGEPKDRVVLWSVPPGHWSLHDNVTGQPMFVTTGHPTVYLQAPTGKVLHRQDDYRGPNDFQAIRKAVTSYDATKDPDLRKTQSTVPVPAALAGFGLLALAFASRKRS